MLYEVITEDYVATFDVKYQKLAIRKGDFKYIQNQDGHLSKVYDIRNNPQELDDSAIRITSYNVCYTKLLRDDGWIYGVFCSERKDPNAPDGDTSSAVAAAGIARTKDLVNFV